MRSLLRLIVLLVPFSLLPMVGCKAKPRDLPWDLTVTVDVPATHSGATDGYVVAFPVEVSGAFRVEADLWFEFSLDGGQTFSPMPIASADAGTVVGNGVFSFPMPFESRTVRWDSSGVAKAAPVQVTLRITVSDRTDAGPNGNGTATVLAPAFTLDNSVPLAFTGIQTNSGPAIAGTAPNYTLALTTGDALDLTVSAAGGAPGEMVTLAVAATGGDLTAGNFGVQAVVPGNTQGADAATRHFDGIAAEAGTWQLRFSASLATGIATAEITLTITVVLANDAPVVTLATSMPTFSGTHPAYAVTLNLTDAFSFEVRASDGVPASGTVTLTGTVTGGSLSAAQAGFSSGFPAVDSGPNGNFIHLEFDGAAATGGTIELTFTANDGALTSVPLVITMTITGNTPPTLERPVGPGTVTGTGPSYVVFVPPGGPLNYSATVIDPDAGQTLTVTTQLAIDSPLTDPTAAGFSTFPPASTIGTAPVMLMFGGTAAQVGDLVVQIFADDGNGGVFVWGRITFKLGANSPPTIGTPSGPGTITGAWPDFAASVQQGNSLDFSITATDADNDPISLTWVVVGGSTVNMPNAGFGQPNSGIVNGTGTATLNFTGTATGTGTLILEFSTGEPETVTLTITLTGATPPIMGASGVSGSDPNFTITLAVGSAHTFTAWGNDTDPGDSQTLVATITGGSLTAAQMGFAQTFPVTANGGSHVAQQFDISPTVAGTIEITVTVTDSFSLSDSLTITITVNLANTRPVLLAPVCHTHALQPDGANFKFAANVGDYVAFEFSATDVDAGQTVDVRAIVYQTSWSAALDNGFGISGGGTVVTSASPALLPLIGTAIRPGFITLEISAEDSENDGALNGFRVRIDINEPPSIAVSTATGSTGGDVPALTAQLAVGDPLAISITADDADATVGEQLTLDISVSGGSLNAATAGFSTTFPLTQTGAFPLTVNLGGTAAASGSVEFSIVATDEDGGRSQSWLTVWIATPGPSIDAIVPRIVRPGMSVVIIGQNFSATAGANAVDFGGQTATITAIASGMLTVTVPVGMANSDVTVTTNGMTSAAFAVQIGPALISRDTLGTPTTADATPTAISPDGRFVLLVTDAPLDAANDANGAGDVYLRDREMGTTELISATAGGLAGNGVSLGGRISADGRFVVFASASTDLVAGDTNGAADVFLRDRQTGTTRRLSVAIHGGEANDASLAPDISADGRWVVFQTAASNLVEFDTNGFTDIVRLDRRSGHFDLVSTDWGGNVANGPSTAPRISADGNRIVFVSTASDIVSLDSNGTADVFVRDLARSETRCASRFNSTFGNGASSEPCISADGRFVAFTTLATNIAGTADGNGVADVLSWEWVTNPNAFAGPRRISFANTVNNPLSTAGGHSPSISGDGAWVAYISTGTDIVAGKTTAFADVFVASFNLGLVAHRLSFDAGNTEANGASVAPQMAADASVVAFGSAATNLVAGDSNGASDGFVSAFSHDIRPACRALAIGESLAGRGATIDVFGYGFGTTAATVGAVLGGQTAGIVSVSPTRIRAMVGGAAGGNGFRVWRLNFALADAGPFAISPCVVSRDAGAVPVGGDSPAITPDGETIVFASDSPTLIAKDFEGHRDIFIFDTRTGSIERVSVDQSRVGADADCFEARVSADGRVIVFATAASNLHAADTNGVTDIYAYDRNFKRPLWLTTAVTDGDTRRPDISADGRFVVFDSTATTLVAGDTNGVRDIFLRDRSTNSTTRISLGPGGIEADGPSQAPRISADGRFVVFETDATNLAPGDTNGATDVVIFDRVAGTISRLSDAPGGPSNGASFGATISADGAWVAFVSEASNLVAGDMNGVADAFAVEVATGTIVRVSVDSVGAEANGATSAASISGNGESIAVTSAASNLIAGDGNGAADVFVHHRLSGTTVRTHAASDGTEADAGAVGRPALDFAGRTVAVTSLASNLSTGDSSATADVFAFAMD